MTHDPNSIESLHERWRARPDASCAAALARASLRHNLAQDARRWGLQAVQMDPQSLPLSILRQCGVPLVALPAAPLEDEASAQAAQLCAIDDATQSAIPLYRLPCLAAFAPQVNDDASVLALIDPDGPNPRGKRTSKPFKLYAFDPARHTDPSDAKAFYTLPPKFIAACAAKTREHLFVAGHDERPNKGHNSRSAFGWYHHRDASPAWQWEGLSKPFDDFVIDGRRLIAVDNIVMPKYFFIYDISQDAPKSMGSVPIPYHTTYERIYGCAHSGRYMALLSGGINHGTVSQFIALYDLDTLRERWCIYWSSHNAALLPWRQIALIGSKLLIASGAHVLALDLQHSSIVEALSATLPEIPKGARFVDSPVMVESDAPEVPTKPEPLPLHFPEGAAVLRVVTHPDAHTAFAIYRLEGQLHALPFDPSICHGP